MKRTLRTTGSQYATAVAERLNAAESDSVLGALAGVMRATSQVHGRVSSRVPRDVLGKVVERLSPLNRALSARRVVLQAFLTSNKPVRIFFGPQSRDREMRILFEIVSASEAGTLDRLKACEHCQGFFVARRDVDRFCDEGCRKKWYNRTPAGRKYNAEYQRKYRKEGKERSERARRYARTTKRRTDV